MRITSMGNMKSIIILRHGEAEDASPEGDFARVLTQKGRRDAYGLGKFMARRSLSPDVAMVSSASRTRMTYEGVIQGAGFTCSPTFSDELYGTSVDRMIAMIQEADDAVDEMLMIGHQPVLGGLLSQLVGQCRFNLPPAGCACLSFSVDRWSSVEAGTGWLMWFHVPDSSRR